jgi:hypothetical protein
MLTAKNLLYKSLDYDMYWKSLKRRKDSQSSKSRKLQLDLLLKAFGISKKNARALSQVPQTENNDVRVESVYGRSGRPDIIGRIKYIKTLTDLQYFTEGEFIADTDVARYQDLAAQIILTTKTICPENALISEQHPLNLVRLFSYLYNFRRSINYFYGYEFIKKKTGIYPIEDEYGFYLKNKFLKSMVGDLAEIDEFLCLLIDPEKRSFKEQDIVYPDFDLEAIDLEYYAAHPGSYQ